MSRSLNRVQLVGNLGADPEIRTTASGKKVANLSIATSRSWTNAQGVTQTKTNWHRIVAWEGLAAVIEKYVRKGSRVLVEGELEYRSYTDAKGIERYVTEVIVNSAAGHQFLMLDGTRASSEVQETVAASAPEDAPTADPFEDAELTEAEQTELQGVGA